MARELGIPAVVDTGAGTHDLRSNTDVTGCCAGGDVGTIYEGALKYDIQKHELNLEHRLKTKLMLNVGDPDMAYEFSHLPCEGVGLARFEFIIMNIIQAHPNALINIAKMPEAVHAQPLKLSLGYDSPTSYYINKLAEGMGKISAAFYPKPAIVRFSDFKTNEYATLPAVRPMSRMRRTR